MITEQTFSENRRYRENLSPKKVAECKGCLSTKKTNTADLQSCVLCPSRLPVSDICRPGRGRIQGSYEVPARPANVGGEVVSLDVDSLLLETWLSNSRLL